LLDALNFMERGDYSGAVRRITTAIEVLVENLAVAAVTRVEGDEAATRFIDRTRTNFPQRLKRIEELSGRELNEGQKTNLDATRKLRHRIVHQGYRITSGERGLAQKCVDTGRWLFNWLEDNPTRKSVREQRIALRSLGRDISYGWLRSKITPEGILILPPSL
jgi:hypothetical protein